MQGGPWQAKNGCKHSCRSLNILSLVSFLFCNLSLPWLPHSIYYKIKVYCFSLPKREKVHYLKLFKGNSFSKEYE